MKEKHVGFTVEVLQDQGMGSTGTVTKGCVTYAPQSVKVELERGMKCFMNQRGEA